MEMMTTTEAIPAAVATTAMEMMTVMEMMTTTEAIPEAIPVAIPVAVTVTEMTIPVVVLNRQMTRHVLLSSKHYIIGIAAPTRNGIYTVSLYKLALAIRTTRQHGNHPRVAEVATMEAITQELAE